MTETVEGQTGPGTSSEPVSPEPQSSEVTGEQSRITELEDQLAEMNSRIGALAHANDERLRQKDAEWSQWADNYRQWTDEQLDKVRSETEGSLLTKLDPEDQAAYLRTSQERADTRRRANAAEQKLLLQQRQQFDSAVGDAVQDALGKGVPREALDTTSPETVKESATKHLIGAAESRAASVTGTLEQQVKDLNEKLEKGLKKVRDDTGVTQATVSGEGEPPPPQEDATIKELDAEIAKIKAKPGRPGAAGTLIALTVERNRRLAEIA